MKKLTTSLLFILGPLCIFSQVSVKALNLDYGSYNVGYKHFYIYDSSRNYSKQFEWTNDLGPRPIAVSFWYPTRDNDRAISVLNYLSIHKQEEEWEDLPDELILGWFQYPNSEENQERINEVTKAISNASVLDGSFPLILYSPGYEGSSVENFALFEYLASHGYYIFSYPSRGAQNKWMSGNNTLNAETQARDLEFLLSKAQSMVNTQQIAAIAHSFGGNAQILAQMRNNNLSALVSLDGSEKYLPATIEKSYYYDLTSIDVPYVHFSQKDIPIDVLRKDNLPSSINSSFHFFDSLEYSEALSIKMNDLTHSNFTSLGMLLLERDKRQDNSEPLILYSHKLLYRSTLLFLDNHLKKKGEFLKVLSLSANLDNRPEKVLSFQYKGAKSKAFSFEDFHHLAQQSKYQGLASIHDTIKKSYPEFQFDEWQLNNLGLQLGFHPNNPQYGIEVLLFATSLFSSSSNLFDSLGEVYLHLGKEKEAINQFKRAIYLDPENQNAQKRLKALSK